MPGKSERTKKRIVDAANQLFYRKGFNRTSFSDVVAEAEVPRGNIYYYFKTKDELLRAVIKQRMEVIGTMLLDWNQSYATPLERLERFVRIIYDSTPTLLRSGCPMGSINIELAKQQPDLMAETKQLFDLFKNWLIEQFTALGYTAEAEQLSLELLARGQGVITIGQIYQDPGFLERGADEINQWLHNLARYA